MWEWIMSELYDMARAIGIDNASIDDIVMDCMVSLLENPKQAKKIYKSKKKYYLRTLITRQAYDGESKQQCFKNKTDFSRYRRIKEVCDKYGIKDIPSNAYKISAIIDDETVYSIAVVSTLLSQRLTRVYSKDLNGLKNEEIETWI